MDYAKILNRINYRKERKRRKRSSSLQDKSEVHRYRAKTSVAPLPLRSNRVLIKVRGLGKAIGLPMISFFLHLFNHQSVHARNFGSVSTLVSPCWICREKSLWPPEASSLRKHPGFQPYESANYCPEHSGHCLDFQALHRPHPPPEECLSHLLFLKKSCSAFQVQPHGPSQCSSGCGTPLSSFSCCPGLCLGSVHWGTCRGVLIQSLQSLQKWTKGVSTAKEATLSQANLIYLPTQSRGSRIQPGNDGERCKLIHGKKSSRKRS